MPVTKMAHLNGNVICLIDTETSGLQAGVHDMLQIAIVPVDENFDPRQDVLPFLYALKPKRPEMAQADALKVNGRNMADAILNGVDPDRLVDMFEEWFLTLRLAPGKKIMPLGQNYQFDKGFIIDWMGQLNYEHHFDYHYRDTMSTALFINDRASHYGSAPPFPKVRLQYLASQLNIEHPNLHDATTDAVLTGKVYKRMLQMYINV